MTGCDVNDDTLIDLDDIYFLVDVIQGREVSSNGDLNGDASKDILDVMTLASALLLNHGTANCEPTEANRIRANRHRGIH